MLKTSRPLKNKWFYIKKCMLLTSKIGEDKIWIIIKLIFN